MKDYIDFDEFGIVEVRCMNCGTPVITRDYTEVKDKKAVNGTIRAFAPKRLSSYRQVELDVDSGDRKIYIEPIVCKECEKKELDGEKLLEAVTHGWLKEANHHNANPKKIAKLNKLIPSMKVVGKVKRRAA